MKSAADNFFGSLVYVFWGSRARGPGGELYIISWRWGGESRGDVASITCTLL